MSAGCSKRFVWTRVAAGLLVLAPCAALADGVSPVLNVFQPNAWLPASIVTAVIILFESALLRWRIRTVSFARTLWRSFLINLASSTAGSALWLAFGRDSSFDRNWMSLFLAFFVITLLTEIPLLYFFYRGASVNWKRACLLGVGINSASYAVVLAGETALFIGWVGYANHEDRAELSKDRHPELVTRSTGVIYATMEKGTNVALRMFDVKNGRWKDVTNSPLMDPYKWDIRGNRCAFIRWPANNTNGETIVVAGLPGFGLIREINLSRVVESPFHYHPGWEGPSELALSPDGAKVAVLFRVADAVAYRNSSSYYALGDKCTLVVFDVSTGRELARAVRRASGRGLCWLANSETVLFSSFDDEGLYDATPPDVRGTIAYGIDPERNEKFRQWLFSFTPKLYLVLRFGEGQSPELSLGSGHIFVKHGGTVQVLDAKGNELESFLLPRLGSSPAVPSPDGKLVLASIQPRSPFAAGGRLTLIELGGSGLRHILAEDFVCRYEWVSE